jgi:hypothetical protein
LSEQALLDTFYLSAAVAVRAAAGLASRTGAAAIAVGTLLGTVNPDIGTATECCFFKGDGYLMMQVGSAPGASTSAASAESIEEILENTAESGTKAKSPNPCPKLPSTPAWPKRS